MKKIPARGAPGLNRLSIFSTSWVEREGIGAEDSGEGIRLAADTV